MDKEAQERQLLSTYELICSALDRFGSNIREYHWNPEAEKLTNAKTHLETAERFMPNLLNGFRRFKELAESGCAHRYMVTFCRVKNPEDGDHYLIRGPVGEEDSIPADGPRLMGEELAQKAMEIVPQLLKDIASGCKGIEFRFEDPLVWEDTVIIRYTTYQPE